MPSSPKIPKSKILETALSFLIREGFTSLNIKTLAFEIGCSTQPISWHFGNMEELRKELANYALSYANKKMTPHSDNAFEAFTEIGNAYVNIAFEEPNLFKFLFLNEGSGYCMGGMESICKSSEDIDLLESITQLFDIDTNNAADYIKNSVIYSHGILSLYVSGVIKDNKHNIIRMIDNAGYAFLSQVGGDIDFAKSLNNKLKSEVIESQKEGARK